MKAIHKALAFGAAALLLAGCTTAASPSAAPSQAGSASAAAKKSSIAHVVNGSLGDQSFFDDAESGITALKSAGHDTKTLQADANNPAQWKANLESVAGKYDVIVAGSADMVDPVAEVAKKFPNQKFVFYDDVVDAKTVASIMFRQNEGSFLAGVLSGLVTTSPDKFPNAKGKKIVGMVGGQDVPVIRDFYKGFEAGVKAVDPTIQIKLSFTGNWTDANKGYDQAKTMFDQGADVVYQVAGGSGAGVLKAAKAAKKYSIGVDANQNDLQPGYVLASMLKNVGTGIKTAVEASDAGTLTYGETTYYGLANKGVGLTFEKNSDIVPADIRTKIDEYAQQVVDGKITVPTEFE